MSSTKRSETSLNIQLQCSVVASGTVWSQTAAMLLSHTVMRNVAVTEWLTNFFEQDSSNHSRKRLTNLFLTPIARRAVGMADKLFRTAGQLEPFEQLTIFLNGELELLERMLIFLNGQLEPFERMLISLNGYLEPFKWYLSPFERLKNGLRTAIRLRTANRKERFRVKGHK